MTARSFLYRRGIDQCIYPSADHPDAATAEQKARQVAARRYGEQESQAMFMRGDLRIHIEEEPNE